MSVPSPAEPVVMLLTVEQAAELLGVGRSTMYGLVMDGAVESVTIGRLRRIPREALSEFLADLRQQSSSPRHIA